MQEIMYMANWREYRYPRLMEMNCVEGGVQFEFRLMVTNGRRVIEKQIPSSFDFQLNNTLKIKAIIKMRVE